MSKRVLSLLMALVFCFSMLPTAVLAETANAAAEETQNVEDTVDVPSVGEDTVVQSGEDGGVAVQAGEHTDHALCTHEGTCSCPEDAKNNAFTDAKPLTWRTTKKDGVDCSYLYIDGEEADFTYVSKFWCCELPGGNYYLADDLTLSYAIRIKENATVNLCLNGYSITKITDDISGLEGVITIDGGGTLSLCDCKNSGKITHESGKIGRGVMGGTSEKGATFNMFGGEISGNNSGTDTSSGQLQSGAGVEMMYSDFYMYGGKITGNHVKAAEMYGGGGVYMSHGTFTMYGGEISKNTSPKHAASHIVLSICEAAPSAATRQPKMAAA